MAHARLNLVKFSWSLVAATVTLAAASFLPVRANLGETVEQIVARYGKPTGFAEADAKSPFGRIVFKASGFELLLFVLNNREVGARVSKVDKTGFTDAEMQTIMSNDSAGSNWMPRPSSDPTCLAWSRADQATVLYDKVKHMLILTSPEMAQALNGRNPVASPPSIPAQAKQVEP